MIDFACKKLNLKEVIRCGLGITKTEQELLHYLLNHEWITAQELTKKTKNSLATTQRSLKNLHEKKLIERRQQNLDKGGYLYAYHAKNKKHIKEELKKILRHWINNVENNLNNW